MGAVPELIPISELRARQNEILIGLKKRPAILTQHGRAAAVLVNPEQWDRLFARLRALEEALEQAEDARAVKAIEARLASGEEVLLDWEDVEAELNALPNGDRASDEG
jgi:PHD/YefM family antitoxin component YafN of YafNO toxin-antitoxin module